MRSVRSCFTAASPASARGRSELGLGWHDSGTAGGKRRPSVHTLEEVTAEGEVK